MKTEELREKYGKRHAFEWFTRAEDQRYWRMTKNMIKEEHKKTTAIIGINAVVTLAVAITLFIHCIKRD